MPAIPPSPSVPAVFTFDEFELDIPAFELRRAGVPVPMEPQVFEVLAFLVENAGRVLTKDEILDQVWPERYVSEASLNSRVMSARKALGDSGSQQRYIKTVHGRGYRFAAAASVAPPPLAEPPPALAALPAAPVSPTTFFGREAEVARIHALLAQPACRLLTIAGPGGIGKTSLALHATRQFTADGAAPPFVAFEHVEPDHFAAALASGLGVQPGSGDVAAQLVQVFRQRPALVVLDNLEHLVEAAGPVLGRILEAAPEARFVITSRTTLGLAFEWVMRVEGLSLDAADGGLPAASRLFIDRAARANAGGLPAGGAEVLAICRAVDGMPLAIELAASLTRYLPLPRIREVVENDAAGALTTSLHSLPERHRSVRALFEASLKQLSAAEHEVLQALSVFEGPFDSTAAEAVAHAPLSTLVTLLDGSLLQPRDGSFSMHPLLRQYLRCPDCPLPPFAEEAHATYYTSLVGEHAAALQGRGQLAAMEALEACSTNVIAAWRWAVANARIDLIERARRGLFTFLVFRGRFLEANALAEAALAVIDERESPESAAGLRVHHAWILMRIGQTARAGASVQRAIAISRDAELGWIPGFGSDPRLVVAAFRVGAGDYHGSLAVARQALSLAEADGDEAGTAFAAWLVAVSLYRQVEIAAVPLPGGKFEFHPAEGETRVAEAAHYLDRAVSILESNEEVWLRAYVEIERGLLASGRGERESACASYRASYALRRRLDDPQGMASALLYLADSLVDLGQLEEAARLHDEVRTLLPRSADATGNAELLRSAGIAAYVGGDYATARQLLREALETSRALAFINNVTGSLRALGDVFLAEGKRDLARRIMAAVAAHSSTTPGSRAKARHALLQLGGEVPPVATVDESIDDLVDEAIRASVPLEQWLAPLEQWLAGDALAISAA